MKYVSKRTIVIYKIGTKTYKLIKDIAKEYGVATTTAVDWAKKGRTSGGDMIRKTTKIY